MSSGEPRPVVVTGVGALGPTGIGKDALWRRLCGAEPPAGPGAQGRVPEFDLFALTGFRESAHTRHMDRYSRYAVLAAKLAVDDGGLRIEEANAERVGVVFGSDYGCLSSNEQHIHDFRIRGPRRVDPMVFQGTVSNTVNGYTSILLGARGPSTAVSDRVSAYLALCTAYDLVASGRADAVLAGGVEELGGALAGTRAFRAGALGGRRAGSAGALNDGAVVLLLESREAAAARGAQPYAEFTGYTWTSAAAHEQQPAGRLSRPLADVVGEMARPEAGETALFCEGGEGSELLQAALAGSGRVTRVAALERLLGPALASTPTPAACVLSVHAGVLPAAVRTEGGEGGGPVAAKALGAALAARFDEDGSAIVLGFRRSFTTGTQA